MILKSILVFGISLFAGVSSVVAHGRECAEGIDYSDGLVWKVSEVIYDAQRALIRSEFVDGMVCRHSSEFGGRVTQLQALSSELKALRAEIDRLGSVNYSQFDLPWWDLENNQPTVIKAALSPRNQLFLSTVISTDFFRLGAPLPVEDLNLATAKALFCADERKMQRAIERLLDCQR